LVVTSCFHNENGTMQGVDLHSYVAQAPNGAPVPTFNGYVVLLNFRSPARVKAQDGITIDGTASFQQMADWYAIPHVPIPVPPPHASQVGLNLIHVMNSSSRTWMGVHSVTLNGASAAVCVKSAVSYNQNCAQPISGMSNNVVLNLSSVVTEPTWGDYIGSWARMWFNAVTSWAVGQGIRKGIRDTVPIKDQSGRDIVEQLLESIARHINRRNKDFVFPDNEVVQTLLDVPKAISEWVQESVDRALEGSQ
jgi:hypothetical protein